MSWPRSQPGTSSIQIRSVTAKPSCLSSRTRSCACIYLKQSGASRTWTLSAWPLRVNSLTDSHKFQLLAASNISLWRTAYTPYVRATCWNCMIYCTQILCRNSIRLSCSSIQRIVNKRTSQRTKVNISFKMRRIWIPIRIYFWVHLCEIVYGLPPGCHNMQSRFVSNIYSYICLLFTICYFPANDVPILLFTSC